MQLTNWSPNRLCQNRAAMLDAEFWLLTSGRQAWRP
jgi:hypothetical protein